MRLFFVFFLLLCAPLAAATAPDSIAGKVYRSARAFTSSRGEDTIVFEEGGRFVYLKYAALEPGLSIIFAPPILAPRSDGTYRYERTSDTEALIRLTHDDGTQRNLPLTFTSPTGGGWVDVINPSSFFLTDLAAARAVPARNVSLRGRVAPGSPLIAGFIVPGGRPADPLAGWHRYIPPPGEKFQEVLIRVVGPSLAAFGLTDAWRDPDFSLYRENAPAIVYQTHNPDWEGGTGLGQSPETGQGLRKIFSYLGAFPLAANAKDAADVVRLTPGAYTIVCQAPAGDTGGEALIEVYFLP